MHLIESHPTLELVFQPPRFPCCNKMNIANIQYNYEMLSLNKIETVLNEITTSINTIVDNIFNALNLTDSLFYNKVGKIAVLCSE